MYPWKYKIFKAKSCNHRGERPVSSIRAIPGGVKAFIGPVAGNGAGLGGVLVIRIILQGVNAGDEDAYELREL
jgi:hypothetical protein